MYVAIFLAFYELKRENTHDARVVHYAGLPPVIETDASSPFSDLVGPYDGRTPSKTPRRKRKRRGMYVGSSNSSYHNIAQELA